MRPKPAKTPANLPRENDTWYCAWRRLRGWLEDEDGEIIRPAVLLLLKIKPEPSLIVGVEMVNADSAQAGLEDFLLQSMRKPFKSSHIKAHRPRQILFERTDLAQKLAPALEKLQIEVGTAELPEDAQEILDEIESQFKGEEAPPPGLLQVEGVSPELVADLYAAAAACYRAQPWDWLADSQPLAVHFSSTDRRGFVQLMGNAGLQYGLLLYWRWESVLHAFQASQDPTQQIPPDGWRSFTFESPDLIPFDDLDAAEAHGWEIANPQAYPSAITYHPDGSIERPSREELIYYEALLHALPIFTQQHLELSEDEEDYEPVEVPISVQTHDGPLTVTFSYPAGELPDMPDFEEDWLEDIYFEDEDDEDDEMEDEEALAHFQQMLRSDPSDQDEFRYPTLDLLLELGRFAEAQELLDAFPEDATTTWLYTRALFAYKNDGDTPEARAALQAALAHNPHVPAYLLGSKQTPETTNLNPIPGSEQDAMLYVMGNFPYWFQARQATDWLKAQAAPLDAAPKKKAGRGQRKNRRG